MPKPKKVKFDYKNVKVNEEPLSITKIGEINTVEQSPIFVLILFVFLVAFVFLLPTITNFFNKEEEKPDYSLPSTKEPTDTPIEGEAAEIRYYDYSSSLVVSLEDVLKVSNFNLNQMDNTISFTIANNGTSKFYFNKHNYYLEIYSENNTLLERILLKKDAITKGESNSYEYEIKKNTVNQIKKLVFLEKKIDDYPNVTLNKNESGEEVLVCSKGYENISYKFSDGKLLTIKNEFSASSDMDNYEVVKNEWQTKANLYNQVSGATTTFMEVGNSFGVDIALDLKNMKVSQLNNAYYYEYETLAKVVDFEMKAQGFSCN